MIALLITVATIVTSQQAAPTNKQRYEQFLDLHNQRLIDKTRENLAEAEKLLDALKARKTYGRAAKLAVQQEKKTVRDEIKVHKRDMKKLNHQKRSKRYTWPKPVLDFDSSDSYVGLIGPLWKNSNSGTTNQVSGAYHTLSIIDDDEMLIQLTYSGTYGRVLWGKRGSYDASSLRPMKRTTSPVLLKGKPTTGIVQDQILDIAGDYFEITGTYTYPTALGSSNTVFVFEPFDMTEITP